MIISFRLKKLISSLLKLSFICSLISGCAAFYDEYYYTSNNDCSQRGYYGCHNTQTIYKPVQPERQIRRTYIERPYYRREQEPVRIGEGARPAVSDRNTRTIIRPVTPYTPYTPPPVRIGEGARPTAPDTAPPVPVGSGVRPAIPDTPPRISIGERARPSTPDNSPAVSIGSGARPASPATPVSPPPAVPSTPDDSAQPSDNSLYNPYKE